MATALYYHIRAGHEAPQKTFLDVFSEECHPIYVKALFHITINADVWLTLSIPQLKDQREPNDIQTLPRLRVIYKFIDTIFKVQKVHSLPFH